MFEQLGGSSGPDAENEVKVGEPGQVTDYQDQAYDYKIDEEVPVIEMTPSEVMSRDSYARKLEQTLEEERQKRHQLAEQVEQLRKFNSEISS